LATAVVGEPALEGGDDVVGVEVLAELLQAAANTTTAAPNSDKRFAEIMAAEPSQLVTT
jgi:hypothetical protein